MSCPNLRALADGLKPRGHLHISLGAFHLKGVVVTSVCGPSLRRRAVSWEGSASGEGIGTAAMMRHMCRLCVCWVLGVHIHVPIGRSNRQWLADRCASQPCIDFLLEERPPQQQRDGSSSTRGAAVAPRPQPRRQRPIKGRAGRSRASGQAPGCRH